MQTGTKDTSVYPIAAVAFLDHVADLCEVRVHCKYHENSVVNDDSHNQIETASHDIEEKDTDSKGDKASRAAGGRRSTQIDKQP